VVTLPLIADDSVGLEVESAPSEAALELKVNVKLGLTDAETAT
jgi:hypothetical protein